MKKILNTLCLMLFISIQQTIGCDVCQNNQPKVLKNITHGTGPEGNWDYIIIWSAVIIVVVALIMSIKYLIRPNENDPGHIKNSVLN